MARITLCDTAEAAVALRPNPTPCASWASTRKPGTILQSPNVPLIPSSSRRSWLESMILSILLMAALTTVLVCPLLAASAIDRL